MASAIGFLLMATSTPLQWQKQYPTAEAADKFLAGQVASRTRNADANDMIYYFGASEDYNPWAHLEKITAPLLAIKFGRRLRESSRAADDGRGDDPAEARALRADPHLGRDARPRVALGAGAVERGAGAVSGGAAVGRSVDVLAPLHFDITRGAQLVALLSDGWRRLAFGSDRGVPGRVITIAGRQVAIIGVLQRGFRRVSLADAPDAFMPLRSVAEVGSPLTNYFADPAHDSSPTAGVGLVARVPDGERVSAVRARLEALPMPLPPTPGARGTPRRLGAVGIDEHAVPAAVRPGMVQFTRLLAVTVALLLLIGGGTVGLLLLVRTEARREELAVFRAARVDLAAGLKSE